MASLFQFSIRSLIVAVTIAAVGIAALLNANPWWEAGAWLAALGMLACAILFCVYRREGQRAFWLGFAIFGGLYLGLLVFSALLNQHFQLLPSQLSRLAYEWVVPDSRRSQYLAPPGNPVSPVTTTAYSYTGFGPYQPPNTTVVPAPPVAIGAMYAPATGGSPLPATVAFVTPTPNARYVPVETFVSIGHTLWLLLAAAVGGKICQWIHRTRPKDPV